MSREYPGGWFGESWDAPCCTGDRHMPTPVGDKCVDCGSEIVVEDQGMIIPFAAGTPAVLTAYHLDCFLDAVIPKDLRPPLPAKDTYRIETSPENAPCAACGGDHWTPEDGWSHARFDE